jgi:alpha-1,6-mannosyltransferase
MVIAIDSGRPICDLTQSYAPVGGGGIGTYLRQKRDYVLANSEYRLLQIVPGAQDLVIEHGRHIWVEVGAEQVRGSPNYRFITRTSAVREVLEQYRPQLIESQCPWVLPWTAINYRRAHPDTALVAGYHTDFPNTHVYRVGASLFGDCVARGLRRLSASYAGTTYREFDRVYTLGQDMRGVLSQYGVAHVDVLSLGVDAETFHPGRRDPGLRAELGLPATGPLLAYAGRLDNEKRADRLIAMFRELPPELGASMILIGEGKLRDQMAEAVRGLPVVLPGYCADRAALARLLASSDIYVSAMADETFGLSVLEAQACGLPVVGFASGAMVQRVQPGLGELVALDDVAAMARAVAAVWHDDPAAIGRRARAHVTQRFSWDHTFDTLLGEVYPRAMVAAWRRQRNANWFRRTQGQPVLASQRAG